MPVPGCTGLERSAVVLCLNASRARDRSRERLYVGMSRATDLLVVVGDLEVVRVQGGGADVARRLGVGRYGSAVITRRIRAEPAMPAALDILVGSVIHTGRPDDQDADRHR